MARGRRPAREERQRPRKWSRGGFQGRSRKRRRDADQEDERPHAPGPGALVYDPETDRYYPANSTPWHIVHGSAGRAPGPSSSSSSSSSTVAANPVSGSSKTAENTTSSRDRSKASSNDACDKAFASRRIQGRYLGIINDGLCRRELGMASAFMPTARFLRSALPGLEVRQQISTGKGYPFVMEGNRIVFANQIQDSIYFSSIPVDKSEEFATQARESYATMHYPGLNNGHAIAASSADDNSLCFVSVPFGQKSVYTSIYSFSSILHWNWVCPRTPDAVACAFPEFRSSNSPRIAMAVEKRLAVYDNPTGGQPQQFSTRSDIRSLAFVDGAQSVLCGTRSGAIVHADLRDRSKQVWNPCTTQRLVNWLRPLRTFNEQHVLVSFSPVLAPSGNGKTRGQNDFEDLIARFDRRMLNKPLLTFADHVGDHTPETPAVSRDERLLSALGRDGTVRIWDVANAKLVTEKPLPEATKSGPRFCTMVACLDYPNAGRRRVARNLQAVTLWCGYPAQGQFYGLEATARACSHA